MKVTHNDPVVEEIREVRHRISARFGHDPAKLVAYYMKMQEQHRDQLLGSKQPPERKGQSAA